MELASYCPSGTENFEVASRFLENLWTPTSLHCQQISAVKMCCSVISHTYL